ncbi:YraN family protein [Phaeobacter sp. CAU 1743]|uniref:YraN family protein n=1 Tax=Phaeobacter sp. CAU 1743 TaxID=3140367 RepID=UPI0023B6B523
MEGRHHQGQRAHLAGKAAEDAAARAYEARGYRVEARRWRGPGGEIDLILRKGDMLVFAEVKHSATFASAAARITPTQMQRIQASAAHFLEGEPRGQLTEARLDAVFVNGEGQVEILENAFGQG